MSEDLQALLKLSGHSEIEVCVTFSLFTSAQNLQGVSESDAVAALVLAAINDDDPSVSLEQVYSALCKSRSESQLVR
jgi:hypothetical protein